MFYGKKPFCCIVMALILMLSAAALAGQAYADAILPPAETMTEAHTNPLIIVLIVAAIVVAALVVVGAVRSAKKRNSGDQSRRN